MRRLLCDIPGKTGRKPVSQETVRQVIELAMSPPPEHSSHWTLRALAKRQGIAVSTVFGILKRNGLEPHRVKTFKVSRDPRFELKVRDVVGLYVDPPDHAVVISVDEKTRIQALGRTQTPLPMKPGHPGTRTHDDRRNGTTCLMAALDVATGKVTGEMVERHRSEEFLAFLDNVAGGIEPGTPVHVILDNVSSHKSAEVNQWLKQHKNWTFHFTPTSASWMNAVEGVVFLIDPLRISRIVSCRFGCFFPRFSDISGHWHWFQFRFDPHAFLSGDRRSARRLPRRFRKAMAAAAAAIIRFGRTSFRLARAPSRVSGSCRSSPWHRPAGPAGPVCRFARGRLRPCPPRCRNRSRNRCA